MASELIDQFMWWQGPEFLRLSPATWPDVKTCDLNYEAQLEMVKNLPPVTISLVTTSSTFVVQSTKGLIDCKKFGSLNQLLRVTSYVFRFIKKCRKQGNSCEYIISRTEMNQSELLWIKAVQRSIFAREIQSLHSCSPQATCSVGLYYTCTVSTVLFT